MQYHAALFSRPTWKEAINSREEKKGSPHKLTGIGNSLIETRNGSDQVTQQHVWDNLVGQYIDCLAQVANNTTQGVDDLCDQELYVLQDQQYNILALVDDTGDIVERYEYSLYGKRTILNADQAAIGRSVFAMNCGFQGLYHDTETGLIYNRARMLSPTLERFIQRDPLGYPDGMNSYAAYHVMHGGLDPTGKSVDEVKAGGTTYFHVYSEGIFSTSFVATFEAKGLEEDIAVAREVARKLDQRVSLSNVVDGISVAADVAEIAIRIANAPLDMALSAKEFIDKPSIMSAAGILPFFPGSVKKVDDLLGGVKGTRLSTGIQYPKSGGIRKACEDWKKLTEGVQVTRRGENLRTAPLGNGATATLRKDSKGEWAISIQQKQQDVKTVKVRYGE